MRIKTLPFLAFLSTALLSVSSSGQTWYWTSQADSSNSQTASYVAVDRNDNPVYTGYCIGTRMAFGHIGITITGSQDDFLVKYTSAGSPVWARDARALTPSATVFGMSVATDRNNAVIETGYFIDSIAFGAFHLKSNSSNYNTYLVKYDANGNVLWATSATPSISFNCENLAYTVATDKQNNILITGYFMDTAYFGSYTLAAAGTDMFLVKYSPAGNVIWATTATLGGGADAYSFSVATDDSSNVFIGGNIEGLVTFGSTPTLNGNASVYLAKYDSSGKAKWSLNTTATPGSEYPTPVVVDRSNNVYIGAQFTNASITFGPSTVTDGTPGSCSNSLLAKYNGNGTPLWAACADFISQDEVCTIIESSAATDRCNNVYWSGLCSDTFGVGPVKVTIPNGWQNPSTPFAYVIQLDSNGKAIAGAALANQNGNSFSNAMAVDSLSKALFASELVSPATLVVGNDTVNRYLGNSTCFLSKFAVVPAISNSKSNDSICSGDSLVLKIVPVAGSTYTWSNGKTTDSITVKPPKTTTYFVAINNGCIIDTSFIKVTVVSYAVGITGNDSICKGDTALLIGSGGGGYSWSNGKTTSSIKVAPATTTTYTLTANNGHCSKDTTFTVNVSPLPIASITPIPNDSVCKGDSILLKGSGGTRYKWNNGKTTSTIWVSPSTNTTYTLYASGTIACSDSSSITIKVIPAITASISVSIDTICPHGTTTITATGAGGQVTYLWNTGATSSSINVTDTITTKYIATVYGVCDSVKDTATITVIPLAKPSIIGNSFRCKGAKDTLTVSGGTTYLWSNGSTSNKYFTGTINADSTITVTAYNSLGCPDTGSFKIGIMPAPGLTLADTNTCLNNPVTIYAAATGTGPFTYSWSPGGETNSIITVPDTGQIYKLIVSNGCVTTKSIQLAPVIPTLNVCCDKTIFEGDDTTLVAYGDSIKSYSWSPEVVCLNPPCDSVKVSPTVTTTYTITGTDSLGCQIQSVITIMVEIPCFNLTVPNVFTPTNPGVYGLDNIFYIKTTNLNSWSILIYDRWGKEMFKSTNPTQYWDGNTEGGGQAPAGVYYYIIDGTCQGNTYKKNGFVQLIR